jgi:hypothetical protein
LGLLLEDNQVGVISIDAFEGGLHRQTAIIVKELFTAALCTSRLDGSIPCLLCKEENLTMPKLLRPL